MPRAPLVGRREAEFRHLGAVHQHPQQRLDVLAIDVVESTRLRAVQIEYSDQPARP